MEPTRRPPIERPGWNDQAAVALLVLVAGHLLAVEPTADPLTPDRLARVVGAYHDLPALIAACGDSPSAPVRRGATSRPSSSASTAARCSSVTSLICSSPTLHPSGYNCSQELTCTYLALVAVAICRQGYVKALYVVFFQLVSAICSVF